MDVQDPITRQLMAARMSPVERSNSRKFFGMRGLSSVHPRKERIKKLLFMIFNVANAAIGAGILGKVFTRVDTERGWCLDQPVMMRL